MFRHWRRLKLQRKVIDAVFYQVIINFPPHRLQLQQTGVIGCIDMYGCYPVMPADIPDMQVVNHWNPCRDIYRIMKKRKYRDQIIALYMAKAIDPMPLRTVLSRFRELYISSTLKKDLGPDELSRIPCYV